MTRQEQGVDFATNLAMARPGRSFDFHDSPEWARIVTKLGKKDRWHRVSGPGVPYPVLLRLGRSPQGQLVCTGLIAGALDEVEVSATSLRQIPLGEILGDLVRLDKHLAKDPGLRWLFSPSGVRPFTRLTAHGPNGLPSKHFEEVAAIYRQAQLRAPGAPVKWMTEQWRTPEGRPTPAPTMRRWLQRCRDMGLLGASIPGKPGEAPKKKRKGGQL